MAGPAGSFEKAFLFIPAAILAHATASNFPDNITPDPSLADTGLRNENLAVWSCFATFYAALQKALPDETNWPSPALTSTSLVPAAGNVLGTRLGPVLQGVVNDVVKQVAPQLGPIVNQLVDLLGKLPGNTPTPTPAPAPTPAPIPSP